MRIIIRWRRVLRSDELGRVLLLLQLPFAQLDDFEVADVGAIDDEADKRADGLYAIDASGSRIDVKEMVGTIVHDLCDVAVTADEELRRTGEDHSPHGGIVTTGIAADMLHQHIHALHLETLHLGIAETKVVAVDVAADSTKGDRQLFEAVGHLG